MKYKETNDYSFLLGKNHFVYDTKEDENFFNIIGKNIGRYHKFLDGELTEYVMKDEQSVA